MDFMPMNKKQDERAALFRLYAPLYRVLNGLDGRSQASFEAVRDIVCEYHVFMSESSLRLYEKYAQAVTAQKEQKENGEYDDDDSFFVIGADDGGLPDEPDELLELLKASVNREYASLRHALRLDRVIPQPKEDAPRQP